MSGDLAGRGGSVVFGFANTGRVITRKDQIPPTGFNSIVHSCTAITQPVVQYGSTGLINTFELLQLMKAADFAGIPFVFDFDGNAHNVRYHWKRSLQPGLDILGSQLNMNWLGLSGKQKLDKQIKFDPVALTQAFHKGGFITAIELGALALQSNSWAEFYRMLAEVICRLVNKDLEGKVIDTRSLYSPEFEAMTLGEYSSQLVEKLGVGVGLINMPNGHRVETGSQLLQGIADLTFGDALDSGYWLAGAAVYDQMYALGKLGPTIYMVKDGSAGRVHEVADEYLRDPNQLYLLPAGLFRLNVVGQNEDDHIDLLVMFELMKRWGEKKSAETIRTIWDLIEVPLAIEHIGRKTVVTLNLDGIANISVRDVE